jgi:group II intron reverse transcriptase/maturase
MYSFYGVSAMESIRSQHAIVVKSYLHAAFERVKENHGCAGVDGIGIEEFEKDVDERLERLAHQLETGTYIPWPLRKIVVERADGKVRTLVVPIVRDRVAQTVVAQILTTRFEAEFESCSFAYRHGLGVRPAVQEIIHWRDQGFTHVVDADIDSFFDEIDQKKLSHKLEDILWKKDAPGPSLGNPHFYLTLLKQWVRAEIWDGRSIVPLKRGIPQGAVVSPMLANLFLDELDEALQSHKLKLVRYADDFLVLCKTDAAAKEALELTDHVLARMHLHLSEDKTKLTDFDQGFKFLGVIFVRSLVMLPYDHPKRILKTISIAPLLPPELAMRYSAPKASRLRPAKTGRQAPTTGALHVTIQELLKSKTDAASEKQQAALEDDAPPEK